MKYKIRDFETNSKKGIEGKAREILKKDKPNTILEGEDYEFMIEYFSKFHCEWEQKKGKEIRAIRRIINPKFGRNMAFWIERNDGSSTDISFIISNIEKKNYDREFRQAMRKVIDPQIVQFKDEAFKETDIILCPLTNQTVSKIGCHVDHFNPSFDKLIKTFISQNSIELKEELFPKGRDNQIEYDINDDEMKKQFYDFHKQNANLRVTSAKGNQRRKRK